MRMPPPLLLLLPENECTPVLDVFGVRWMGQGCQNRARQSQDLSQHRRRAQIADCSLQGGENVALRPVRDPRQAVCGVPACVTFR